VELGDKLHLLRELVSGAADCYALHWQSDRNGSQWGPIYRPLSDATLLEHLSGRVEIGTYPLIASDGGDLPTCRWICADFDGKRPGSNWQRDVRKALEFLMEHDGCPAFVNLSRSGQGAHIRMLFAEPVPAWMARRWVTAWLVEAQVMKDPSEVEDDYDAVDMNFPSFDRLIPPQDRLYESQDDQPRRPGNLAGAPLNTRLARRNGGTLPIDPQQAARGLFEPDGQHWTHVRRALEARTWGTAELLQGLRDAPGSPDLKPPSRARRALPVIPGTSSELAFTVAFCEFFRRMRTEKHTYPLYMALATQLHRFGEEGRLAFHAVASTDARYRAHKTDQKWDQTADLSPVRCDTLVSLGWRCPLLGTRSCASRSPALFALAARVELL
jgi:hypothetical protein